MVQILSSVTKIATLAVAVLLEPISAARTDDDPDVPVEPSFFDDLIAPDFEESKVRPMVFPEAREAKEATMVAAEAATRADEARARAQQQATIAESAMSVSKKQAAEAKVAMYTSERAGLEAKASEVKAHLEQDEAVATKKIHGFDEEATRKMAEENRAADIKVKDIMHEAEVSLHQSKLNTDHGIKEREHKLDSRSKELEAEASKKIQEIENEYISRRDEKEKDIQMRANERIQHANEQAFQRTKRSEEQTERDISAVWSENAAVLRSKAEHILKINSDADLQVKKQADIAEESLLRVEEQKKRIINTGKEAEERSLKENEERTDRKVKAASVMVMKKIKEIDDSKNHINDEANMTLTHMNTVTKDKIERKQDMAAQTIRSNVERYTTDSHQVAALRHNQVKEHEAVLGQATFQEKRVEKQVADRKGEKDSTAKTLAEALTAETAAKKAAFEAHLEEVSIVAASKRNPAALQAELAAAAATQKYRDSAAYAAATKTIADADRLAVMNARTNPLLLSGVPYGGVQKEDYKFTLSDPAPEYAVDGGARAAEINATR